MAVGVKLGVTKAQRALGSEAGGLIAAAYVQRKGTVTSDIYLAGLGGLFGSAGGLAARRATSPGAASSGSIGLQPDQVPRGMLLALLPTALVVFEQRKLTELDRFKVGSYRVEDLGTVGGVARRYRILTDDGRDFTLDARKTGVSRANLPAMDLIRDASKQS